MIDDEFPAGEWQELSGSFPTLETLEERDEWAEILLAQDVENEGARCLLVKDSEGRMMIRVRFSDGSQDVYDVQIRRELEIPGPPDESESN